MAARPRPSSSSRPPSAHRRGATRDDPDQPRVQRHPAPRTKQPRLQDLPPHLPVSQRRRGQELDEDVVPCRSRWLHGPRAPAQPAAQRPRQPGRAGLPGPASPAADLGRPMCLPSCVLPRVPLGDGASLRSTTPSEPDLSTGFLIDNRYGDRRFTWRLGDDYLGGSRRRAWTRVVMESMFFSLPVGS